MGGALVCDGQAPNGPIGRLQMPAPKNHAPFGVVVYSAQSSFNLDSIYFLAFPSASILHELPFLRPAGEFGLLGHPFRLVTQL